MSAIQFVTKKTVCLETDLIQCVLCMYCYLIFVARSMAVCWSCACLSAVSVFIESTVCTIGMNLLTSHKTWAWLCGPQTHPSWVLFISYFTDLSFISVWSNYSTTGHQSSAAVWQINQYSPCYTSQVQAHVQGTVSFSFENSQPVCLASVLILSFHLHLCFPSSNFRGHFQDGQTK